MVDKEISLKDSEVDQLKQVTYLIQQTAFKDRTEKEVNRRISKT